jgi:hypothetical protein
MWRVEKYLLCIDRWTDVTSILLQRRKRATLGVVKFFDVSSGKILLAVSRWRSHLGAEDVTAECFRHSLPLLYPSFPVTYVVYFFPASLFSLPLHRCEPSWVPADLRRLAFTALRPYETHCSFGLQIVGGVFNIWRWIFVWVVCTW